MSERPGSSTPYRVFQTEQEYQDHVDALIGEKLAKLRRAVRRAEKRAAELEEEVAELRKELHSGGTTPLRRT